MTLRGRSIMRSRTVLFAAAEAILSALILIGPLAFGAVEPWAVALLQVLILLLGSVVAVQFALSGEVPSQSVASLAASVALIGLIQSSVIHGIAASPSGILFSASGFYTARLTFMWACYAILGACASRLFSHPAARVRFAWTVFLVGAIIAFVGIAQFSQGNKFFYGYRPIRNGIPFGPYTNYNHAASLMGAALCMGIGLLVAPIAAEGQRPFGDRIALQALVLALLVLICFGILMTGSRAGLLAMLVGVGVFVGGWAFLGRWKIRITPKWLALLVASFVIVGVFFNPGAYRFALAAIVHGAAFRGEIYTSCLSVILDFPILGVGLGAVPAAMHPYQTVWLGRLLESGHSDVFDFLLQIGMVGSALILWFLYRLVATCLNGCRTESSEVAVLRLGALAASAVFLAHGVVESNLRIPANAALIVSLLAYASTSCSPRRGEVRAEPSVLASYSLAATAVVMVLMLSVPIRSARGAWLFHQAVERQGEGAIELLRRAVRLDARPEYHYALAVQYINAADRVSYDRPLLALALGESSAALESFPFHQAYRSLHSAILTKLGRPRDAAAFPI